MDLQEPLLNSPAQPSSYPTPQEQTIPNTDNDHEVQLIRSLKERRQEVNENPFEDLKICEGFFIIFFMAIIFTVFVFRRPGKDWILTLANIINCLATVGLLVFHLFFPPVRQQLFSEIRRKIRRFRRRIFSK